MSLITSPNMNLPIPGVGTQAGPTYATNIDSCMTLIDQHDHSLGNGVQVTPSGLNINTPLPFNGNSATQLAYLTLIAQSVTPPDFSMYFSGVDFYVVDGNGNAVKMTSGGLVNATSSGIASGSASASFAAGVLVVDAAANTPANIQGASLLMGNNVANPKYLTLSPPSAMGANYTLTLPHVSPSGTQFLGIDTSGNITPSAQPITAAATVSLGLQVIRGVVNISGVIISGEGFTVIPVGPGTLEIDYSTTFATIPAVVVTPIITIGSPTLGANSVWITNTGVPFTQACQVNINNSGTPINSGEFSFIAIG